MNTSQANAIAFLLAQHEATKHDLPESDETVKVLSVALVPTPSKRTVKRTVKRDAEEQAIALRNNSLPPVIVPLPETRPMCIESATMFIRELRSVGRRRTEHGMWHTDSREVRQDTIRAIASFVGYNLAQSFGAQDATARGLANRMLSPHKVLGPSRQEVIASAVQGGTIVVYGLP